MAAKKKSRKRTKQSEFASDRESSGKFSLFESDLPAVISEVIGALASTIANLAEHNEIFKSIAKISRKQFDAYKDAGFTDEQALYLTESAMQRAGAMLQGVKQVLAT